MFLDHLFRNYLLQPIAQYHIRL